MAPPTASKPSRAKSAKPAKSLGNASEAKLLLRESRKIVEGLGKMFAPCCEVVLHDLTQPEHAILAIQTPLSGRKVGDPATEMGLARIGDPSFPDIVQNYSNSFPDGRPVKSTSIGIKDSEGRYVAAICLNLDVSLFSSMQRVLQQLTQVDIAPAPVAETLKASTHSDVTRAIETFAAQLNLQPRAMSVAQRNALIRLLHSSGLLQIRGAASTVATVLGISRTSIYNALK